MPYNFAYGNDFGGVAQMDLANEQMRQTGWENAINRFVNVAQTQQAMQQRMKEWQAQSENVARELANREAQLQLQRENYAQAAMEGRRNFDLAARKLDDERQHWQEQLELNKGYLDAYKKQIDQNPTDKDAKEQTALAEREIQNGVHYTDENSLLRAFPKIPVVVASSLVRQSALMNQQRGNQNAEQSAITDRNRKASEIMNRWELANKQAKLYKELEDNARSNWLPWNWGASGRPDSANVARNKAALDALALEKARIEKGMERKQFTLDQDASSGMWSPTFQPQFTPSITNTPSAAPVMQRPAAPPMTSPDGLPLSPSQAYMLQWQQQATNNPVALGASPSMPRFIYTNDTFVPVQ